MRVLMLSWEYPPKIVGGIARHVEEISWAIAARGHEVHVVTCDFPGAPDEETIKGVHVHRVAPYTPADDFFHWVHQLNNAMRDRSKLLLDEWTGGKSVKRAKSGIILHPHDWLAHFAAKELKHAYKLPLVGTIHATEHGRNQGIRTDTQRYVNSVEEDLSAESWRVIVCSWYMKGEVEHALATPSDKIDVIPNGVHADKFDFPFSEAERAAFRSHFAAPHEKIVFFVGRPAWEKGAHLLVEAFARVRQMYPGCKLVIAGGGNREHLVQQAANLGIHQQTYFTGFISDDALLRLYKCADVAVYPSLYEPFGIVALEAMAAGVPVVVSDAGGLKEVIEHQISGTLTFAGDVNSLAWGILRVLRDPEYARWTAGNAAVRVREIFNWERIAEQTEQVYNRVWSEYRTSTW